MRWPSFFVLAYVIIALQLGLSGYVSWGGAQPNFVLPIVIFVTLNARREEGLCGAFVLGLIQDLLTQQPLGLYAFSYSLVGLFVLGTQSAVHRDHPLSHLFLTLAAALFTGGVALVNEWIYPKLHGIEHYATPSLARALMRALFTALLAPLLLAGLVRIKWIFGFRGSRHVASGTPQALSIRQ
jgi:rod shape-determining protein MreD